jgi:hypothetical protein
MKAIKKACSGASIYPKKSSVSSKLKSGGKIDPKPDYRHIKKEKRTIMGSKVVVPTAKDSADYRKGFEDVVKKVRNTEINTSSNYIRGQREAKQRNLKSGGTVAKDGKWIQKAINPKHKGYCTPMSKPTCTPKRKALAKTLKAMAAKRKGK